MKYVIAGDLGGTKSAWAPFSLKTDGTLDKMLGEPISFFGRDFKSFAHVCSTVESSFPNGVTFKDAEAVCVGAAGVWDPAEQVIKLPHYWHGRADVAEFASSSGVAPQKISILNDFEAEIYSVRTEVAEQAQKIREGKNNPEADKIVLLGPGTGLGIAALVKNLERALRSEGGNIPITFPCNAMFKSLWPKFLKFWEQNRNSSPRCEDLLSGQGLSDVHYIVTGKRLPPPDVAAIIGDNQNNETAQIFSELLGTFTQAAAYMYWLPSHIYITGGVVKKNPILALSRHYIRSFENCSAHRDELMTVSIALITHQFSSLYGAGEMAACHAKQNNRFN